MARNIKRWQGLGLAGALMSSTGLAAYAQDADAAPGPSEAEPASPHAEYGEGGEGEHGEGGEHAHGEGGEASAGEAGEGEAGESGEGESGEGEGGEAGHDIGALPLPNRLAFMSGHVAAGLALYRAGEPEMGAPHLLHPVSETHEAERAGLDELGFDAALFETVSAALDEGRPASEIEPQLDAAEANLAMLADKAGGDPADIIRYLMDVIVEEYSIALTDGDVSDPGEYQDAFGFAVVARRHATNLPDDVRADVTAEIDALIALWPEAPIAPLDPTPTGAVIAQTSRVALALPRRE